MAHLQEGVLPHLDYTLLSEYSDSQGFQLRTFLAR